MLKYLSLFLCTLWFLTFKTSALKADSSHDFFEQALKKFSKKLSTAPIDSDPILDFIDLAKNSDLSLIESDDVEQFPALIQNQIQNQIQNPLIQLIEVKNNKENGFFLDANVESLHYSFSVDHVPICGPEVKAHLNQNKTVLILGRVPQVTSFTPTSQDQWPSKEKVQALARKTLALNKLMDFTQSRRCYTPYNNSLVPSWELIGLVDFEAFKILSNEKEIFALERLQFDVAAKTSTYPRSPVDGTSSTYDVELDFSGGKYLTSEFFTTHVPTNDNNITRAVPTKETTEGDHALYEFFFDPLTQAPLFQETAVFTHATLMYQFFKSLGYTWYGEKPLRLDLHAVTGSSNSVNNAMYQPGIIFPDGKPRILIGDGDGELLQNLSLDADVVSHELGHHIIYKTLNSTSGESLVVHEGLADFFAFSHSGDPCLGRSICPENSKFCVVQGQCLRTAENSLAYRTDEYLELSPHLKGQLISGTMWDLRTTLNDGAYVTKIVYNALSYLVSESGIKDLLFAVLYADDVKSGSKNSCAIFDEFTKRGFDPLLVNAKCNTKSTWPVLKSSDGPIDLTPTPTTKKKDTGLFGCGSIGGMGPMPPDQKWLLFFILLCPAFLPMIIARLRKKSPITEKG